MTRNFEEEYKKYAGSSIPDLWSRIEAAIDEGANTSEKNVSIVEARTANKAAAGSERKIIKFNPAYATLIAAAACLVLAIGVVRFIGGAKNEGTSDAASEAPASDEAYTYEAEAAEAYDEAAQETAGPDMNAEAAAESASAKREEDKDGLSDGLGFGFGNSAASAPASEASEASAGYDEEAPEEVYEEAAPEAAAETAEESYEDAGEYEAGYEAAAGTVTCIICTIQGRNDPDEGYAYDITVSDPLNSGFEKGDKVRMFVTEDLIDTLEGITGSENAGTEYRIFLEKREEGFFFKKF
ncbi:MAG: hypothetical protein K6F34_10780 [Lachnospiraceae bacterium]|nr:hypothetical protein [Lachnospiraceae bacterium]